MIEDMTEVIRSLSSEYQKLGRTTYEYDGVEYTEENVTGTAFGLMMPLDYIDREEVIGLGYTVTGKMKFYMATADGVLTETDIIVDEKGIQWKMVPEMKDYEHLGGFNKYILTKDVV